MARPKLKIDGKMVEGMAGVGCSALTIATVLGCEHKTIERRFGVAMKKGGEELNFKLRHKQVELAMAGNVTMLIWLGKQRLNQSDKQELALFDGFDIVIGKKKIDY